MSQQTELNSSEKPNTSKNLNVQMAVEWYIETMSNKHIGFEMYVNANKEIIEQAKEIEKNNIIDSYSFGYTNGFDDAKLPIPIRVDDGEQYYNETFKTK
ncbi:MAG: hypothetical protein ACOVNU_09930 [Candidatus Kapaibacteriota bacterium]